MVTVAELGVRVVVGELLANVDLQAALFGLDPEPAEQVVPAGLVALGLLLVLDVGRFLLLRELLKLVAELLDESSEEVHVGVLAQLVEDEPVADVELLEHEADGLPGLAVISVSNFG